MIFIITGFVHSRLFPDIFPKQFFPHLRLPNRWSIETLKNLFFQNALQMSVTTVQCGQMRVLKLLILWLYIVPMSTCWSFKKKIQTFYNFPDLISHFQTFSMPGKLLCKFQDFFKNSRLCMNPMITVILGWGRVSTETNLCCFVSASRLYLTSLTSDFSTSKAPSRSLTLSWTKKVK